MKALEATIPEQRMAVDDRELPMTIRKKKASPPKRAARVSKVVIRSEPRRRPSFPLEYRFQPFVERASFFLVSILQPDHDMFNICRIGLLLTS